MKVSLTPKEIMHVYHLVVSRPTNDRELQTKLETKLSHSVLESLEKADEVDKMHAYQEWTSSEEKKIEDLEKMNEEIFSKVKKVSGKLRKSK